MPLHFLKEEPEYKLAVWKIEEDKDFFASKLELTEFDKSEIACITAENKLMQWFASRYLIKYLFSSNHILNLQKDDFGKPYVEGWPYKISLSHCRNFAAVIVGRSDCGIDVELIDPRIERIASKFLYEHELTNILDEEEYIKILTVYWSAKESLYKMYGRKGLTFKTQLIVDPFELNEKGTLSSYLRIAEEVTPLEVHYTILNDMVLSYVIGSLKNNGTEHFG